MLSRSVQWVWIDSSLWCSRRWKAKCSGWSRKGWDRYKHTNRSGDGGPVVGRPKMKPQYHMCLTSWKNRLSAIFLLHGAPLDPIAKQPSLLRSAGPVPAFLWVAAFRSLPVHDIIQISQSHSPMEPGFTSTSCYYKACLPYPLLVHRVPKCSLCVDVPGAVASSCRLWMYVITKLLSMLSVQRQVPCTWPSP